MLPNLVPRQMLVINAVDPPRGAPEVGPVGRLGPRAVQHERETCGARLYRAADSGAFVRIHS